MARKALTTALAVLGGGALVPLLVAHRHDLGAAFALLVTVCPAWLSVAALAEAVSYLTRGGALRAVLRGAAPTVGTAALAVITLVGDAVAYVLPFGFAAGGAVAVGQAHRRGAPRAVAWWGFAVVTLVGMAVLTTLGVVAAGIALVATGPAAPAPGLGLLVVAAVVAGAAAAAAIGRRLSTTRRAARSRDATRRPARSDGADLQLTWSGGPELQPPRAGDAAHLPVRSGGADLQAVRSGGAVPLLGRAAALPLSWTGAPPGWWGGAGPSGMRWAGAGPLRALWDSAARLRTRLRRQPLPARALGAAAVGMLLSWLADLAVLALAFVALGQQPPWTGLVLAYCLGQAASALPFTPGGLAVVEGGLTATLVAFGGCPAGTLTAVLLYRLISHWAVVPAGGLAWLVLRRRSTDEFRREPWSAFAKGDERCPTRT